MCAPFSGKRVFIGDSITARWPLATYFPDTINMGIPGNRQADIAARFQRDAIWRNPNTIVLLAGTNDVARDQTSGIALIQWMATKARAQRIKVLLATVPPLFSDQPWLPTSYLNGIAIALNSVLVAWAAANAFPVADYYSAMVLSDGSQNPAMFIDGVHPSAAGYDAMAPIVGALI